MDQGNPIFGRFGATTLAIALLCLSQSLMATTQTPQKLKKPATASSQHVASRKTSSKSAATKSGLAKHPRGTRHSRNWRHRGQQSVDARRTQQIQQALIQSHYLDGQPTGTMDAKTQEALRRFQAANGWQSKVVPDSRALIKLGLGPSNDRLLNPESAMTFNVEAKSTASTPASSSADTPQQ